MGSNSGDNEKTPLLHKQLDALENDISNGELNRTKPSFQKTLFAYLLGFVSMLVTSFSISCVQILGGAVPEFELNIWRFATQFVLSLPFVIHNPSIVRIPRQAAWPMTGVLLIYVTHNTSFYSAPAYLPVGTLQGMTTAITISVTVLLSICIKNERCLHLYISALVCITGIILLLQPNFLFQNAGLPSLPQPNWTSPCLASLQIPDFANTSDFPNRTVEAPKVPSGSAYIGYILTAISGISIGVGLHFTKASMKYVTPICVTFWTGLIGSSVSIVLMLILETPTFPTRIDCVLYLLAHAFGTAQSSFVFPYCASLVVPSIFALILAMKIVSLLIFQYTLLSNIKPGIGNWVEIFGAVICFIGSAIGPITQLIIEKREIDRNKLLLNADNTDKTDEL